MPESKKKTATKRSTKAVPVSSNRLYESEAVALQSLRLIAAPRPEDDLPVQQMERTCSGSKFSLELIYNLIDCIKAI